MWKLARTPTWIGGLLFAMFVATIFALLGQWQLARAVESGTVVERDTETVKQLESVATPQQPITADAAEHLVTVTGSFARDSYVVLSGRLHDGDPGYWVMGELVTSDSDAAGSSVAVALGWAPSEHAAASAVDSLRATSGTAPVVVTGRYLPTEPPNEDDFENGEQNSVSIAALINQWPTAPDGVYAGYIVESAPHAGLTVIDAPEPSNEVALNWLNIFYAIEWVIFAALAFFIWYRLLKDAWERELEEAAELEEARQLADLS
jgi:surfeit locus 1 family protein